MYCCSICLSDEEETYMKDLEAGFLISVAYACNIGGTATLTGASPNVVIKTEVDK